MRTLAVSVFLLMLMVGIFLGCPSAPPPAGLSSADEQAIRQTVDQAFKIANTSGDWDAYTRLYYAPDAITNMPNTPAKRGREAISASMKAGPRVSDLKADIIEINGTRDFGYVYGT